MYERGMIYLKKTQYVRTRVGDTKYCKKEETTNSHIAILGNKV